MIRVTTEADHALSLSHYHRPLPNFTAHLTLRPHKINFRQGDYYLDGPIFLKSGVTLGGGFSDDSPRWPYLRRYDGPNTGNTAEDAIIVADGATGAEVRPS